MHQHLASSSVSSWVAKIFFFSECSSCDFVVRYKKARREWQEDQWADVRREKEEAAARYRRKQEDRQRQKEEMEKRKKEKEEGVKADGETR